MIENLVPKSMQGKTAKPGKLPYEILTFNSQADYNAADTESDMKKAVAAKFNTYGDAFLYAHHLDTAPFQAFKIIIRA